MLSFIYFKEQQLSFAVCPFHPVPKRESLSMHTYFEQQKITCYALTFKLIEIQASSFTSYP